MDYLAITAVVIFMLSNVLLFFLSIKFVDWKKARRDGTAIGLLVWGGYRNPWGKRYVASDGIKLMALLDYVRFYAVFFVLPLFLVEVLFEAALP